MYMHMYMYISVLPALLLILLYTGMMLIASGYVEQYSVASYLRRWLKTDQNRPKTVKNTPIFACFLMFLNHFCNISSRWYFFGSRVPTSYAEILFGIFPVISGYFQIFPTPNSCGIFPVISGYFQIFPTPHTCGIFPVIPCFSPIWRSKLFRHMSTSKKVLDCGNGYKESFTGDAGGVI